MSLALSPPRGTAGGSSHAGNSGQLAWRTAGAWCQIACFGRLPCSPPAFSFFSFTPSLLFHCFHFPPPPHLLSVFPASPFISLKTLLLLPKHQPLFSLPDLFSVHLSFPCLFKFLRSSRVFTTQVVSRLYDRTVSQELNPAVWLCVADPTQHIWHAMFCVV